MGWQLILAGIGAVRDYVATHVLTCLVPAFFLAGGMVTFVRREAVLEHLGEQASRLKSFSLAAASAFLIAACSCTVIPVASGRFAAVRASEWPSSFWGGARREGPGAEYDQVPARNDRLAAGWGCGFHGRRVLRAVEDCTHDGPQHWRYQPRIRAATMLVPRIVPVLNRLRS